MRRVGGLVVGLLLLLLVAVGVGGWWWGTRAHPQESGTLRLPGLDSPVEVRRDALGVPHLYAESRRDLVFAQGVVHAQDRLWQMDFQRRVGLGRLSELFGETTLETDRFLRTIGVGAAAQHDLDALDPETRELLQAYADGINAYVAAAPALPLEHRLLGADFEPWEPVHTLAWSKMMQWDLNGNWEEELYRGRLAAALDPALTATLLRDGTGVGATLALGAPRLDRLEVALAPVRLALSNSAGERGSNNWVIGPSRTATGRPLLANDPHLSPGIPSIWYAVGLHGGGIDVVGASFPGAPLVVIGHNARIAWGVTNLPTDTQDLFIERLSEDGTRYEVEGEMVPLTVRREVIRVGADEEVVLEVRETRHGPLLNDVVEGLTEPLAFRWRATTEPATLVAALVALNQAEDWESFLAALELWDTPAQNFVYADVEGNIGYVATGALPIRPAAGGMLPQPGWSGEFDWQGEVPFDALPRFFNPEQGYLLSANQQVFPENYPHYTGTGWAMPYRAERIEALIRERDAHTVESVVSMQADVRAPERARALLAPLLAVKSDDVIVQRAQEQLGEWNQELDGDLPGAGIYQVAYAEVLRAALEDEFPTDEEGRDLFDRYLGFTQKHLDLMAELLDDPDHPLWDDRRTEAREGRDEIISAALASATDWLGRRYGDVPHEWFWGRLHRVPFEHPLGDFTVGSIRPLYPLLSRSLEGVGGDRTTVNAVGHTLRDGFTANNLPSYRQVVDVGAWEGSRMLHTTGQSGHPLHPHYDSMLERWRAVDLAPMLWSDAQTREAAAGRTLRLEPAR